MNKAALAVTLAALALAAGAQQPASRPAPVTRSTTGTATRPVAMPAGWKLPKFERVDPVGFAVSEGGRFAVLPVLADSSNRSAPIFRCWLADIERKNLVELSDVLAEELKDAPYALNATFSPDGKFLAIRAIRTGEQRGAAVFLMDLLDRSCTRLAEGLMVVPVWMGPRLAVSAVDANADLQPIRIFDPARKTSGEIAIRGIIAAGDASGSVIVCGCDANAPTAPLNMKDYDRASMLAMQPGGKVLRSLGTLSEVVTMPVVSPGGKYIAFQSRPPADANASPARVEVLATTGDERWSLDARVLPLSVGDDGAVLTIQSVRTRPEGAAVQLWPRGKPPRTLIEDGAWAAALSGARLYYITGFDEKSMWVTDATK